jgi:iron complex transport system ATP-binding protein
MIAFRMEHVSFTYGDRFELRHVNLSANEGEMVGLIGPNGSGKSTLLKLISGVLPALEGEIHLDGLDLRHAKRKAVSQRVAVVPQQFHMPFAFRMEEVVMLGRTPFLRGFSDGDMKDHAIVGQAMESVGVRHLEGRFFNELSGGERQKVVLAMALAQQPRLLLLDEPTAHLDINHQVEILQLLKRLNQEHGLTIIAAMHDLNLASLYFQRLIMLKAGRIVADGAPCAVLTSRLIAEVFGAYVQVQSHPMVEVPYIVILPPDGATLNTTALAAREPSVRAGLGGIDATP